MHRFGPTLAVCLVLTCVVNAVAVETRIKDITTIEGERINFIWGYGLVSGLQGTGGKTPVTREFAANFLMNLGNRVDPILRGRIGNNTQLKTDNLSVVYVSAELPVNAQPGQKIDVTVAAYDDASSLLGGELMFTTLLGIDDNIYATAAGKVSLGGGFAFGGNAASVQKNHPTTGRISGGAIVEKSTPIECFDPTCIRLLLTHSDWTTAQRITDAINGFAAGSATTENSSMVRVTTPAMLNDRARFISLLNQLPIEPDVVARVVLNDRTGTATIGGNVRLSRVAISHGSLSVVTGETPEVSQPAPFSNGETTVVPRTEIDVMQEKRPIKLMDDSATVADLIDGLNALGVTPGDISAIFQQLHSSGSLQAQLEFR